MTIAIRLSTGTTLVPVKLEHGETVVESATVHAGQGFVVLEPGTTEFTITGREVSEKTSVFKHFKRIINTEEELPEVVLGEEGMTILREVWENVDDFYRRVTEDTVTKTTPTRHIRLGDTKIIDVDSSSVPDTAVNWTPVPENLGVPAPLSAMVRGTLSSVPELVAEKVKGHNRSVEVKSLYGDRTSKNLVVKFSVDFADERTKLVKKNPLNTRRDAKRVKVYDTKLVELQTVIPAVITADTLEEAHAEVERIAKSIIDNVNDPVAVCVTCQGEGLVPTNGVRERKLR